MNFYTCTGKIIEEPQWLRFNHTALSKIIFVRPSNKKSKSYYRIRAIAKGKMARIIFDNYKKNDIVIVEGYIYIKRNPVHKKNNRKKYIAMKIQKIHSLCIGL